MLPEYFILLTYCAGGLVLVLVLTPVTAVIYAANEYLNDQPFIASFMHCMRNF